MDSNTTRSLMRNFLKEFESQKVLTSFQEEDVSFFRKIYNKIFGIKTEREKERLSIFTNNSGTLTIKRPHQYSSVVSSQECMDRQRYENYKNSAIIEKLCNGDNNA